MAIICALDEERGIGKNGELPWYVPADLRRFRKITIPYPVIMGRKTFESIFDKLGTPLPQRTNIVISRDRDYTRLGALMGRSLSEALELGQKCLTEKIFVIGGAQVFEQALRLADKLYLTLIKGHFGADVFFPEYPEFDKLISEQCGQSNGYEYRFLELTKWQY